MPDSTNTARDSQQSCRLPAGEPSRLVGFDSSEPTAHNRGKPTAIARIRQRNPYNTIIMVGDGITDLEAVQVRRPAAVQLQQHVAAEGTACGCSPCCVHPFPQVLVV